MGTINFSEKKIEGNSTISKKAMHRIIDHKDSIHHQLQREEAQWMQLAGDSMVTIGRLERKIKSILICSSSVGLILGFVIGRLV